MVLVRFAHATTVVVAVQEAKEAFGEHVKEDTAVHKIVLRHTTYWQLLSSGMASVLSYLGLSK